MMSRMKSRPAAAAGGAPYPIPPAEMLDTVAAFEAITGSVDSKGWVVLA